MGTIIDRRSFKQSMHTQPQGLFILRDRKLLPESVPHLNIGLTLTERLKDVQRDQRNERVENEFMALIPADCTELILDRLDILFDFSWHIDVLRLLLKAGRNKRFFIVWPGVVLDHTLQYGEPTAKDYSGLLTKQAQSHMKYGKIEKEGAVLDAVEATHGNHRRFGAAGTFSSEGGSGTGPILC